MVGNSAGEAELEKLELEAFRAVSGGDFVRGRILHGLSLGNPSVESTAYLVKSRTKRADSLVLKVLDRRAKDPNYTAFKAQDIVGLRLLALFRNELPILVRKFLEFIQEAHQGSTAIFAGSSLKETVSEIKIYGLNALIDPNMDFCVREFMDYGFGPVLENDQDNPAPGSIQISRKGSQYSSIHLVLRALGPAGNESDIVPVEVQIRTSLEDVWGEIEHRALYKGKQLQRGQGNRRAADDWLSGLSRRTQNLKLQLDASSSMADDIELDLSRGDTTEIISSYEMETSFGLSKLRRIRGNPDIDRAAAEAADSLQVFYDMVREERAGEVLKSRSDWFEALALGTQRLEEAAHAVRDQKVKLNEDDEFQLKMELALSYYWQAVLMKNQSRPSKKLAGLADGWHQAIRKATGLYASLLSCGKYLSRSALFLRLGNALAFQGRHDTARLQYKTAYELLDRDVSIASDSYLRLRIPRQWGFALWFQGSRLDQEAQELGISSLHHEQERECYFEAAAATMPLINLDFGDEEADMGARTPAEEQRVTANNILFYTVRYFETGGRMEDLEPIGINADSIRELLNLLIGGGVEKIAIITLADTARKALLFTEQPELAVKCAQRVISLKDVRDLAVTLTEYHYKKMIEEAEATIATYPQYA